MAIFFLLFTFFIRRFKCYCFPSALTLTSSSCFYLFHQLYLSLLTPARSFLCLPRTLTSSSLTFFLYFNIQSLYFIISFIKTFLPSSLLPCFLPSFTPSSVLRFSPSTFHLNSFPLSRPALILSLPTSLLPLPHPVTSSTFTTHPSSLRLSLLVMPRPTLPPSEHKVPPHCRYAKLAP